MKHLHHAKRAIHVSSKVLLYLFAAVGVSFTGVFFAIRMHWTNVSGTVDLRSDSFQAISSASASQPPSPATGISTAPQGEASQKQSMRDINASLTTLEQSVATLDALRAQKQHTLCTIQVASGYDSVHALQMLRVYAPTQSDTLIKKMLFALEPYVSDTAGYATALRQCEDNKHTNSITIESTEETIANNSAHKNIFPWIVSEEWPILEKAIQKDAATISAIAKKTGVEERLIVSSLIVEQLRLYHTQRALFKEFFEPLNILASATKTSWGVMSIKEATAIAIEEHLTDKTSPYYLGAEYEKMLDFSTTDHTSERYDRLTNERDHTYAYLYGALYMKQLMTQWSQAGYDVSHRPEIVATLFNIGFNSSHPKAAPQVGGAAIEIQDTQYTFGGLAFEFYYSGEMMDTFPLHP